MKLQRHHPNAITNAITNVITNVITNAITLTILELTAEAQLY